MQLKCKLNYIINLTIIITFKITFNYNNLYTHLIRYFLFQISNFQIKIHLKFF